MTTSIIDFGAYRREQEENAQKGLRQAVYTLAQEVQKIETVSKEEVYYRLLPLVAQGLDRVILIETLEQHDDTLFSDIRFWIIDIYDFIIAKSESQKRVERIMLKERRESL
jgi:hypothetical protein